MIKQCPKCGKDFKTYPSVIAQGKGKYCSRDCSDTRNGNKIERACGICKKVFIVGIHRKDDSLRGKYCSMPCYRKSRKGKPSWNKGIPAPWSIGNKHRLGKSNINPNRMSGEDNPKWKGDDVGYTGLHVWIRNNLDKISTCELCGISDLGGHKIHWANKDHKYNRNKEDWMRLCAKCHGAYDKEYQLRRNSV